MREAAELLDLEEYLDRKPKALSGGQRQRVAMGRAIVREPQVFLMDEPLSNLDAKLRVQTRTEIAALQRRLGTTTVYVTHDQVEAMTMGDRVAVLKDGVLQQVDTPRNLYDRPANEFVAGFIGSPGDEPRLGAADRGRRDSRRLTRWRCPARCWRPSSTRAAARRRSGSGPEAVEFVGAGEGFPVEGPGRGEGAEARTRSPTAGCRPTRLPVRGSGRWSCGPTRAGHRRRARSCTWPSARARCTSSPAQTGERVSGADS